MKNKQKFYGFVKEKKMGVIYLNTVVLVLGRALVHLEVFVALQKQKKTLE